jgi:gas vesicle protein
MKRALEEGLVLVAGAGLGLAAMYLLDPTNGSNRRSAIGKAAHGAIDGIHQSLSHAHDAIAKTATSAAQAAVDQAHEMLPPHSAHTPAANASMIAAAAGGGAALFVIGAGMAFLFDPDRGRARRAYLHDQIHSLMHRSGDWMQSKSRHVRNRAYGAVAQARRAARSVGQPDQPAGAT